MAVREVSEETSGLADLGMEFPGGDQLAAAAAAAAAAPALGSVLLIVPVEC